MTDHIKVFYKYLLHYSLVTVAQLSQQYIDHVHWSILVNIWSRLSVAQSNVIAAGADADAVDVDDNVDADAVDHNLQDCHVLSERENTTHIHGQLESYSLLG